MKRVIEKVAFPAHTAPKLTRVAAYARVSSAKDATLHSLSAQVSYYNSLIQRHPGWIFRGVYADEGLTGTKTERKQFQRLMEDCRAGKIDMVVTKSISRLARNTVTLLETIRELKDLGVDVYFEEQNIHSISADGELMLSILASYAQEESLSVSENQKWRIRHNFENGMPWNGTMLGYRYDNGILVIHPEEANVVRLIFDSYLGGMGVAAIANMLNSRGILSRRGNSWYTGTVLRVLRNYAYIGNLLLQKTFTVDFLQKKMKTNEGEVLQYYVQNSHPAIIDPYEWDLVQAEIARRKDLGRRLSSKSGFSATIVCGDCGGYYGSKVWHSTDQYRRTVWQCNDKFKGEHRCMTPHLTEQQIQTLFLRAFNKLHSMRESILEDCLLVQRELFDCTELDAQQTALAEEMELAAELVRRCVEENSLKVQDQMEYLQRYERHVQRYEKLKRNMMPRTLRNSGERNSMTGSEHSLLPSRIRRICR